MDKNYTFNNFKEKFITIHKQRWIKGVNNNNNSVGLTFENILGKEYDSMFFPDYFGLEIKTTTRFSRYPIGLFSLAFDGPDFFETNRIVLEYGSIDYKYKDRKTIMGAIDTKTPIKLTNYSFSLDIDRKKEKLYLCVYDDNILIERRAYITFDNLITRIKLKLTNLVIVHASKKIVNDNLYFRYYAYERYILKDNIDFLELIDKNIIKIVIMCRVSRSGVEEGRQRNKSLVFKINKKDIEKMFDLVEKFDGDSCSCFVKI